MCSSEDSSEFWTRLLTKHGRFSAELIAEYAGKLANNGYEPAAFKGANGGVRQEGKQWIMDMQIVPGKAQLICNAIEAHLLAKAISGVLLLCISSAILARSEAHCVVKAPPVQLSHPPLRVALLQSSGLVLQMEDRSASN
jgi:hypothetical protein